MKKWEKEGWNSKYFHYKETFYLYTKATSKKLFSIVETMDTLKSFLLSECFNGEKEIEHSSHPHRVSLDRSRWLGGRLLGFGKKNRGSNLNSCFFFNGKR